MSSVKCKCTSTLMSASPTISSVTPLRAVEGGRVTLRGTGFRSTGSLKSPSAISRRACCLPRARGSSSRCPSDLEGGADADPHRGRSRRDRVRVGRRRRGRPVSIRSTTRSSIARATFVTYSGSRGQEAPVSIFRVTRGGTREPFVSGIVNATSMAIGPDGQLYVSSRFEGAVYRVNADGTHERVASDLGVACGLAFDGDGMAVRRRSVRNDLPRSRRHSRAVRDAAGQRRGISSGHQPER